MKQYIVAAAVALGLSACLDTSTQGYDIYKECSDVDLILDTRDDFVKVEALGLNFGSTEYLIDDMCVRKSEFFSGSIELEVFTLSSYEKIQYGSGLESYLLEVDGDTIELVRGDDSILNVEITGSMVNSLYHKTPLSVFEFFLYSGRP